MTTAYIVGGALAFAGLILWWAMRSAKKQGAAEQAAKDVKLAHETEGAIRDIQAEERDTDETRKRMREGRF